MEKFPVVIDLSSAHLAAIEERRFWFRPRFVRPFDSKRITAKNDLMFEPYSRCSEDALTWGAPVSLGAFSYLSLGCFLPDTTIGRYCSIGSNVRLMPGGHPLDRVTTSTITYSKRIVELFKEDFGVNMVFKAPERSTSTVIGNDVWIGDDVLIKPGVKIGDGAVVGVRSIVTKDVDPYSIVAGAPATVRRSRFDVLTSEQLSQIAWWNFSPRFLASFDLLDVRQFIASVSASARENRSPDDRWEPPTTSLVDVLLAV